MDKLALHGGAPAKTKPFPTWPHYDEREERALLDVLHSGAWWRTPGTQTKAFEEEFAAYHHARHGIAVTNGTAALEVVLHALGIEPGDEVIVPDFTFVATASAVLSAGALPVLVDVTPDTYCLDPALAAAAITARTKAIIAVHMGGHPADLDALAALCERHKLLLIEDCAHAHGSQWRGRAVGTWGVAGTFSFQQSKLLTAGEGGCIITNDDDAERRIRAVHDCGRLPGEWFYAHFIYGSNYRLSEWQGAMLRTQLARLPEQAARRTQSAAYLDEMLPQIAGITPQTHDPRCTHNGQYAYIFHCDARAFAGVSVSRIIEALKAEGVPIQASYPPIHDMALFQSGAYRQRLSGAQREAEHPFLHAPFVQTERAAWETVWLPQTALLGDEQDIIEIIAALRKIQAHAEELQ